MTSAKRLKARTAGRAASGCAGVVFGMFFLIPGIFVTTYFSLYPLYRLQQAQAWTPTPCRILASSVETHSSSDGATYSIAIQYAYVVDGASYTSDAYDFLDFSSSGYAGKEAVVNRYPAGSQATCHVNPEDPTESVLSIALTPGYAVGAFGLIFVAVGAAIAVASIRVSSRGKARSLQGRHVEPIASPESAPTGSIELKVEQSPLSTVIFVAFFALIWNGIIGFMLWQVVLEQEWVPLLFLIPFALIGLGVAGYFVYALLALANPRPRLQLTPGAVPLGSQALLDSRFEGAAHRLEHLRLTLEAREEVTYRRGTDTVTEKHIFHRTVLLDTDDPAMIGHAEVAVAVPEYSMHSLAGSNNKIIWTISVEGRISRWPDVNASFVIEVLPLAQ